MRERETGIIIYIIVLFSGYELFLLVLVLEVPKVTQAHKQY